MKSLTYLLLVSVLVLQFSCSRKSADSNDSIPQPTNAWELMDDPYFGSKVYAFQLSANNNNVYVGYWDGTLEKPCVKKFNPVVKKWEYYGNTPVNIDGNVDAYWARVSFMFRQDGATSYIGFMRSVTDHECLLYRTNGSAWEQLPSVPLNLLPGATPGFLNVDEYGYELTAKNGKVYASIQYDNNTWQSEETGIAVFVFENNNWSLIPERVSYPQIPNSFQWLAYFSDVTINVSKNGNIYLNYWLGERDPDRLSANVSVYNGSTWSRITTSDTHLAFSSSSVTYKFNLDVYEEGNKDNLIMTPCIETSAGYSRVLAYNGTSWKELTTPVPGEKQLLSTTNSTCATCIYAKYSDVRGFVVKKYVNGIWDYVGKPGFTSSGGGGGIGYNQDFTYDNGYLYLACTKDYYKNGTTIIPKGICVYRYKL